MKADMMVGKLDNSKVDTLVEKLAVQMVVMMVEQKVELWVV